MSDREKLFTEKIKLVTIAILATAVAIMTTFLQVNFNIIEQSEDLKRAVTIFSVVIPYLLLDVYFLTVENHDGKYEHRFFSWLRIVFWFLGGFAISSSFNVLSNSTRYETQIIFWSSLIIFFVIRLFGLAARDKNDGE